MTFITRSPPLPMRQKRRDLAPAQAAAFEAWSKAVFADGALDQQTRQLIAVAVAHVTQCPWCIEGHVKGARRAGATPEQIMEAIWVAAEMRAGARATPIPTSHWEFWMKKGTAERTRD